MKSKYIQSVLVGLIGTLVLLLFYVGILYLTTGDIKHPSDQFNTYKFWIIPLVIGFGIQTGLFWYIRTGMDFDKMTSKTSMAAGGGMSGLAMVACCAHHVVDFLPILGLSAIAVFLTDYQAYFFIIGIISNIIGIVWMLSVIFKNKSSLQTGDKFNIKNKFPSSTIVFAGGMLTLVVVAIGSAYFTYNVFVAPLVSNRSDTVSSSKSNNAQYPTKIDEQANVKIYVTPLVFGTKESKNIFTIKFETHSVDLDYDFISIITMKDDSGSTYKAIEWTGGRGGHHLSGNIIFPKLNSGVKNIEIDMKGIGGADRMFSWNL